MALSGIFLVTTLPAPIIAFLPILTPGRITTFAPIQTSLPMYTPVLLVSPYEVLTDIPGSMS